jgi:zinc transport system permease protein
MGVGVISAAAGVFGSFYLNAPPGSLIVIFTIVCFILALPCAKFLERRRRGPQVVEDTDPTVIPHLLASPGEHCENDVPAGHDHSDHIHGDHVHGPGCGHRAIVHGTHVEYLHDGHRHVPHDDHYDEH